MACALAWEMKAAGTSRVDRFMMRSASPGSLSYTRIAAGLSGAMLSNFSWKSRVPRETITILSASPSGYFAARAAASSAEPKPASTYS